MEEWKKLEDNCDGNVWTNKPEEGRLFEYKLRRDRHNVSTLCTHRDGVSWSIFNDSFDVVAWRYIEETIPEMRVRQILQENGYHTVPREVISQIVMALTA